MEPATNPDSQIVPRRSYRRHYSAFLTWMWHFQDFALVDVAIDYRDFMLTGSFVSRFSHLLPMARLKKRRPARIGLPTTVRLANHAAIIAAGLLLRKFRKDADVIAERFSIHCSRPIYYRAKEKIPVVVQLHSLTESKNTFIYHARFALGEGEGHSGHLVHHYTRPPTKS